MGKQYLEAVRSGHAPIFVANFPWPSHRQSASQWVSQSVLPCVDRIEARRWLVAAGFPDTRWIWRQSSNLPSKTSFETMPSPLHPPQAKTLCHWNMFGGLANKVPLSTIDRPIFTRNSVGSKGIALNVLSPSKIPWMHPGSRLNWSWATLLRRLVFHSSFGKGLTKNTKYVRNSRL